MNSVKVFETMERIKALLPEEERKETEARLKLYAEDPAAIRYGSGLAHEVAAAILEAMKENRKATAKAAGRGGLLKTVEKILKSGAATGRASLGKLQTDGATFCACDGYRLIAFRDLPEGLPIWNGEPMNYNRFLTDGRGYSDRVNVPDLPELIARKKEAGKKSGRGLPPLVQVRTESGRELLYNAGFMIDLLQAIPDADLYAGPGNEWATLYAKNSAGDVEAILMGCRAGSGAVVIVA